MVLGYRSFSSLLLLCSSSCGPGVVVPTKSSQCFLPLPTVAKSCLVRADLLQQGTTDTQQKGGKERAREDGEGGIERKGEGKRKRRREGEREG